MVRERERERVQGAVMEKEAREFKTLKPLSLRLLSNAIKTPSPISISYAISLERQVRREREKGEILESVMNVKGAKCGREEKKALMAARYKYSLSLSKWFCRKTRDIITAIRFSSVSFLFLLFISSSLSNTQTIMLLKNSLFFFFLWVVQSL